MDTRTPRQLHALPSTRGSSLGFAARPRRGRRRLLAVGALVGVAALGLQAAEDAPAAGTDTLARPAPPTRGEAAAAPDVTVAEAADAPPAAPVRPFAAVDGATFSLPSTDVLVVGYHEASLPGALAMDPIGTGLSNANTTRITLPPDRAEGAEYHVMSSRGRVLPPTSAVDVVMRDDDPVLAPVDGVVTEVRPYRLYGTHPDTRVEIRPAEAPHLRLVMIHVDDVRVAVGERVTTGATVIAGTANRFPFASHVDRYLDRRWPHVHMEVKDASEARAADGG